MIRTIRNVTHDLSPLAKDFRRKLEYLKNPESPSDLIKITRSLTKDAVLLESYLEILEDEALRNGIEKIPYENDEKYFSERKGETFRNN